MQDLEARLEALRADRRTGAIGLAVAGIDIALDWAADGRPPADLAAALRSMHPAIATVANLAAWLDARGVEGLVELRRSLLEGNQRIAANLKRLIPPGSALITISNSSTVAEALPVLAPRRVVCLESRPGGEGADLAERLRTALPNVEVDLVPDAQMGRLVAEMDCALVGIDAFDKDGSLVHKTGTLPLALCCRHAAVRFYAAGHSFKKSRRLIGQPPDPLFDLTPSELITELITENAATPAPSPRLS